MSYSTSRSPPPSSPATIRHQSLLREFQTGYRAAEQLRCRFTGLPESDDPAPGVSLSDIDLVQVIFNSFSNSLAIARSSDSSSSELSRFATIEDSGRGETSRIKDRRGCYKRRKRGQTWTSEGETPTEDGHAWRKYGQKMILNFEFPRNYYRCTHRTDQGCQALKQVQQISDKPPLYRTTYAGSHTCKNPHNTPVITIPSSSANQSDSSILLSFERASNPQTSPFFPPSIKEELPPAPSPATMNMISMIINQSTASPDSINYLSSFSPDPAAAEPVGSADHGGDVISVGTYSCSPSPRSLDINNYMMFDSQDHLDLPF